MVKIEEDIKLDFSDVLIKPKRSNVNSRSLVDLERTIKFKHSKHIWTGIPIIISNMDTTGTFEMFYECSKYKIITCIHKHYSIEEWTTFSYDSKIEWDYICLSTGISDDDIKKTIEIIDICSQIKMICIDVANGYSENFVNKVKELRILFPHHILIVGNVVCSTMTQELILVGADVVKCGIGPGSVCTTRKITGIGMPQLSCIIECSNTAHELEGLMVSDGGCTTPGCIAKAFAADADFVMLGGMMAGHKQSGGKLINENGEQFKIFYGMSSKEAQDKHSGGLKDYRASEGKCVKIPYRGDINNTIKEILGGIRSTCTYIGAKNIEEMSEKTTFIKVNRTINNIFGN
jgi:GMP reductase